MAKKLPYHITIAVGNWKNYRVFRTDEAIKNYLKTLLNNGYIGFITDMTENGATLKSKTKDIKTMISEIFDFGLCMKRGDKCLHIYETPIKK